MASRSSSTSWTPKQNKRFEDALAEFEEGTPDRWQKVARAVGGGKTAEDVKRYYELLVQDVDDIESGQVPFPKYRPSSSRTSSRTADEEQRLRYLKLQ